VKLTTQLAAVIIVGFVGIAGLVLGLAVLADWSDGAVIGLATALGAIVVNLIVAIRGQQKNAETLASQDRKLDTVVAQTNGLSDRERQDIAERTVATMMARLKNEGHL
jgi:hypothetical protein